jgi:hypothetical protein
LARRPPTDIIGMASPVSSPNALGVVHSLPTGVTSAARHPGVAPAKAGRDLQENPEHGGIDLGDIFALRQVATDEPEPREMAAGDPFGLKGAFIQIMPLTWDSFLLPVMDKTPGSQSDWFCIGSAARLDIQDLSA